MGKINLFTLLSTIVMQFVVGYLWYGPHLFGDVMVAGGHGIDFLKLDVISLLLLILGSFGLTHIFEILVKLTGTKDVGGGLKLGLSVGGFAIGLPIIMLLNLMGFGKVLLLVVFTYLVMVSMLTGSIVVKLNRA